MSLSNEKEIVSAYSEMINLAVRYFPTEVGLPLALVIAEQCKKAVAEVNGWDESFDVDQKSRKVYRTK